MNIPVGTIRSNNDHWAQRFDQVKPSHSHNGLPLLLQKGESATCSFIIPQLLRTIFKSSKLILFENNSVSIHLYKISIHYDSITFNVRLCMKIYRNYSAIILKQRYIALFQ